MAGSGGSGHFGDTDSEGSSIRQCVECDDCRGLGNRRALQFCFLFGVRLGAFHSVSGFGELNTTQEILAANAVEGDGTPVRAIPTGGVVDHERLDSRVIAVADHENMGGKFADGIGSGRHPFGIDLEGEWNVGADRRIRHLCICRVGGGGDTDCQSRSEKSAK